jgi:hypothetical protein
MCINNNGCCISHLLKTKFFRNGDDTVPQFLQPFQIKRQMVGKRVKFWGKVVPDIVCESFRAHSDRNPFCMTLVDALPLLGQLKCVFVLTPERWEIGKEYYFEAVVKGCHSFTLGLKKAMKKITELIGNQQPQRERTNRQQKISMCVDNAMIKYLEFFQMCDPRELSAPNETGEEEPPELAEAFESVDYHDYSGTDSQLDEAENDAGLQSQ